MRLENTPLNKAKFFNLYFDQFVMKERSKRGVSTESSHSIGYMSDRFRKVWLELTPLSQITDKHLEVVADIIGYKDEEYFQRNFGHSRLEHVKMMLTKGNHLTMTDFDKVQHVCDFLRSKRYAVSWMGEPVETFISWGWITLKESKLNQ